MGWERLEVMTELRLSEQLQNAYMLGNKDEIDRLNKEINDKAVSLQKKVTVSPLAFHTVLNDDNSSPIKVYEFLNQSSLGNDWWELEFETIERLLFVNYGVALDDNNRDKIWALKIICMNDRVSKDWFLLNQISVALHGVIADFEILRVCTPAMMISTILTIQKIRPDCEWSRECKKFASIIFVCEGWIAPPPSLHSLLNEEFAELINKDSLVCWPDVYHRYEEMVAKKQVEFGEEMIDIAAKRMYCAELASREYNQ